MPTLPVGFKIKSAVLLIVRSIPSVVILPRDVSEPTAPYLNKAKVVLVVLIVMLPPVTSNLESGVSVPMPTLP